MNAEKEKSKLIGFFARANYSYDNRYLATVSIRHEGSSKFGANHKWGNFPAMSVGWNVSNEHFMEGVAFLSTLKVRAGFGITGSLHSLKVMRIRILNGRKKRNGILVLTMVSLMNV